MKARHVFKIRIVSNDKQWRIALIILDPAVFQKLQKVFFFSRHTYYPVRILAPKFFLVLKHVPYSWLKPSMIRMCMRHAENVSKEEYAYIKDIFKFIYRDYTRELDIHMTELLFDLGNQTPCTADEFEYLKERVLLILPEDDDSFTPEMQKDLTDLIPECTIVEGIDSGHISTMIEVDRYVDEIRRFVGKDPDNG